MCPWALAVKSNYGIFSKDIRTQEVKTMKTRRPIFSMFSFVLAAVCIALFVYLGITTFGALFGINDFTWGGARYTLLALIICIFVGKIIQSAANIIGIQFRT